MEQCLGCVCCSLYMYKIKTRDLFCVATERRDLLVTLRIL
jgi:hypothetical protein